MAVSTSDVQFRHSGGASNSDPDASLGGAKSSNSISGTALNNLFDDVSSAEASAGDTEYRCFYIHNNNGTDTYESVVVWISSNTSSADTDIAIGLGTSAVNGTEQTVADESTAPTSVTFSAPASKGAGLSIGNIPAGQHKAVWVRRTVNAAASAATDTTTINVSGDTAA